MKKDGVLGNILWKFGERISAQVVTTVVTIILARILDPSDYGIIAIVSIFITFANVFVSDGFGSALIQKKNADNLDFSSVLSFNFIFSLVLYGILFISAPYITEFYGEGFELLTPVLRILGIRIILSGINSVQQAYVAKKQIFRKFFLATLLGTIISAVVGIWMAYAGYGVWALVAQYLINTTVDTIVLGISLKWWPGIKISFQRLKKLISYGWKILVSKLIISLFEEGKALLIGKIWTKEDLAFYEKGKVFPALIVTNIDASISSVLFSKMSEISEDPVAVKDACRRSIRFGSYIMAPMMLGLAAVSMNFVSVVLTDKWLPCVPLLQIFCIYYLFQPIHSANLQAIKAMGRSDTFLILEIIKKTFEAIAIVLSIFVFKSVNAIAITAAVLAVAFIFVNAFPNKKLLNYSIWEQLKDIFPGLIIALIMAGSVYMFNFLEFNKIVVLIAQVLVGILIYWVLSIVTKNSEYSFLINSAKNIFSKKKTVVAEGPKNDLGDETIKEEAQNEDNCSDGGM